MLSRTSTSTLHSGSPVAGTATTRFEVVHTYASCNEPSANNQDGRPFLSCRRGLRDAAVFVDVRVPVNLIVRFKD